MERGREGKGGEDHMPYFPPLASASNTSLGITRIKNWSGQKWKSEVTNKTFLVLFTWF